MALDFLNTPVKDLASPNPSPAKPGRPGSPGRGGMRIPGRGGVDMLQEEVDETDVLTPDQRQAHAKAKRETARVVNGQSDGFSLNDLIAPLFFGGLTAAAGMGGQTALLAAGTALGAQEKKKNELREMDLKYNAAGKQRRFSRAMQAITDMRKTPGMGGKAAELTVRIYAEMGYPVDSVDKVTALFEAQDNKVLRKEKESEHLHLRTLGRFEEAEQLEYDNWDLMQPDKKLTPELRARRFRETKRLLEAQDLDTKTVKKRMERLEKDFKNATIQDEILRFNRDQQGKEKPKDRLSTRNTVRRIVDSSVLTIIRKDLDPTTGAMLDKAESQAASESADGQADPGRIVSIWNEMLAKEAAKKGGSKAKPDQRLFADGELYASVWNNIKRTSVVNSEFGENITAEEVFPEEFIRQSIGGLQDVHPPFQGPNQGPPADPSSGASLDVMPDPGNPEILPSGAAPAVDPRIAAEQAGGSDIGLAGLTDKPRVAGRIPPPVAPGGVPVDPQTGQPLAPQHSNPERAAELTEALIDLSEIQLLRELTDRQVARAQALTEELAKLRIQ